MSIFRANVQNHPCITKTRNVKLTAAAAGVGIASVYNILKEHDEQGNFSPAKKYQRRKPLLDVSDEFRNKIRRVIHTFFTKQELPTMEKILASINGDERFPNFSKTSLRRLLKEINFRFKGRSGRNRVLKEKYEIIAWRRNYLRQIQAFRKQHRPVYYLEETWIDAGQTVMLKNPYGPNKRLVVIHIGSNEGFLKDAMVLFEAEKILDYQEEMKSAIFEEWFAKTLPKLKENAVIVLENASGHRRKLEKIPTATTSKAEIQEYLLSKGVQLEEDMVKAELLALVKEAKLAANNYVVDEMAKADKKIVLRIPPYHCELNPLKIIWGDIKSQILRKKFTFELKNVNALFVDAVTQVTVEKWQKAIEQVKNVEKEMWQLDIVMEQQVEPLIADLGSTSESDTESE